jgi:CRISPR system Cascade subunit CasB
LVDKESQDSGDRTEAEKRIEKRLLALLNCHRDDLPDHLRQVISLLKSKDTPVNWAKLLHDIKGWDWESRDVQRSWAWGFWASRAPEGQTEEVKAAAEVAGD